MTVAREMWVEVALADGTMLMGMLVLRDEERVVLRFAHWVSLDLPQPRQEYLQVERHGHGVVEVDAAEVVLVSDATNDFFQRWDIVEWPKHRRVKNQRWVSKAKEAATKIYAPRYAPLRGTIDG